VRFIDDAVEPNWLDPMSAMGVEDDIKVCRHYIKLGATE
jgi:hypothetical protein